MTTMNENTIAGKWLEIKGEVQKAWGNLTSDELEQTKGDIKAIGGLIQQRYGAAQESYRQALTDIFERFSDKKEAAIDSAKETLKN
ncbi:MAG: CsbD family protein [Pseudobdellovibrionaceae bacterium]